MAHKTLIAFLALLCSIDLFSQDTLKTKVLNEIVVTGYRTVNGIGHFEDSQGEIIYAGKKTEVILVDSLDANKALNNTRQILGRIPGLTIVESETGGFVANGFGIRGLNPSQALEMNVRQNGYNIAADIYGYNETYYLPPMEAVERIELIKGASSLQFGAQFGGMVNYSIREAPTDEAFVFRTSQTVGSFGLFNSYNEVGGTIGKVSYLGFVQWRTMDGWRPNSEQDQLTGFGKITYTPSDKLSLSFEYSMLRNEIKMPGGLTDAQMEENSRSSFRSRNWLNSPWNVFTASLNYKINTSTSLSLKATYLSGQRNLVWFEKGPEVLDLPDPTTGEYADREVEREFMKNLTTEARFLSHNKLFGKSNTLAGGIRVSYAAFERLEDGQGTNGSDFDLSVVNNLYEQELEYTTLNAAPFIENIFHISDRFSITPGARLEYLYSTIEGELEDEDTGAEIETEDSKTRVFLLFGAGAQYEYDNGSNIYANITQSYRPIVYAQLTPFGVYSQVDPDMKDAKGYNVDLGYRGAIKNTINFDVGVFYLAYNNRPGLVLRTDDNGDPYTFRTNVANSVHLGVESYVELNVLTLFNSTSRAKLSIFDSFAWINAEYATGEFKGNTVEYAPRVVNRVGLGFSYQRFSTTAQWSYQTRAYGDANNTVYSDDALVGEIPAYGVFDWSASYKWRILSAKAGVNNIGDARYLTQRTDEYPGPGIIPSIGRSFYVGLSAVIK